MCMHLFFFTLYINIITDESHPEMSHPNEADQNATKYYHVSNESDQNAIKDYHVSTNPKQF